MLTYWETLIATQSNIAVSDSYAALWGKRAQNNYTVATYTGTLPATLRTVAGYLESYKIYGSTVQDGTPTPENPIMPSGCGERTENLFDKDITEGIEDNYYIDKTTGNKVHNVQYYISAPIAVTSEEKYLWAFRITSGGSSHSAPTLGFFDANNNQIGVASHGAGVKAFSFTTPVNCVYVRASVYKFDVGEAMLVEGSTDLPYEPYGYKLPILSNSTVTNIYIGDTPLEKDEYVDSKSGKIYRMVDGVLTPTDPPVLLPQIPTFAPTTTISYGGGTGAQPEKVEFKYKVKR